MSIIIVGIGEAEFDGIKFILLIRILYNNSVVEIIGPSKPPDVSELLIAVDFCDILYSA